MAVIVCTYPHFARVSTHDHEGTDGAALGANYGGKYRQCDMGGGGAAHWYGCDALGAGRNGVADLSGERRAVRMAEGYLGFITRARRGAAEGARGRGKGPGAGTVEVAGAGRGRVPESECRAGKGGLRRNQGAKPERRGHRIRTPSRRGAGTVSGRQAGPVRAPYQDAMLERRGDGIRRPCRTGAGAVSRGMAGWCGRGIGGWPWAGGGGLAKTAFAAFSQYMARPGDHH